MRRFIVFPIKEDDIHAYVREAMGICVGYSRTKAYLLLDKLIGCVCVEMRYAVLACFVVGLYKVTSKANSQKSEKSLVVSFQYARSFNTLCLYKSVTAF